MCNCDEDIYYYLDKEKNKQMELHWKNILKQNIKYDRPNIVK